MRRRIEPVRPQVEEKVLDVTASMQGTLRFDDPVNLRISGKFEGSLDTKGVLFIGERSDIRANISGENISVAGTVNGNIKATKLLKLEHTARVNGDIEVSRVFIEEGAVMNGRIRMDAGAQSRDEWMTMDQVARYLEVEENKVGEWATGGMLPGTRDGGMWLFERSRVDTWIANGKVRG